MAKKLILLMLCIPIIIMVGLFTTSKTVSLAVDVAVNGIEINSNKFIYLDLDNKEEKEKISYTIYPTNAKNKNVSFSVDAYEENSPKADLEIDEDGYINPLSTGKSRVTITTADGGYNASLVVEVVASGLVNITASPIKDVLYVGEESGIDVVFNPITVSDTVLVYESENPNIATIVGNKIKAISKGEATIIVKSEAHPEIKSEFKVKVLNKGVLNIAYPSVTVSSRQGSFIVSVDSIDVSNNNYKIVTKTYDKNGNETNNVSAIAYVNNERNITVEFNNLTNDFDTYYIAVEVYENDLLISNTVNCEIIFSNDFDISVDNDLFSLNIGQRKELLYYFDIIDSSNVKIELNVEDDNIITVNRQAGNRISISAKNTGYTKLVIKATLGDLVKSVEVKVVVLPRAINFLNEVANLDLGNILTLAGDMKNVLELDSTDAINQNLLDFLIVKSNVNNLKLNLALVDGQMKIEIPRFDNINQVVNIGLYFKDEANNEILLAQTNVRLIDEAVTVSNYNELIEATKNNRIIVLANDVVDFPNCKEVSDLDSVSTKIKSTYDITYYKNLGLEQNAYVRVLVSFKNDIYGNGYEINANNLTNGLDATSNNINGIFARSGGPLHFVSASESNSSMASVKGQDNIVFAVYENVSINNVTLKGFNDVTEMTDLDYAGTTVEVLGDNVNINQTRIMNGRTVLRVFGDVVDASKKIHVNVNNSYLAYAREFIIRTGSNRFIDGNVDNPSPYIDNNDQINLTNNKTNYLNGSVNEEEYDNKYINTYLTLSNVALEKSGIFSIGLDSHFAGPLLADASATGQFGNLMNLLKGWNDLAKTSYGVKLTLDNIVRIYDWKKLDDVDSSTLIEVNDKFEYAEALKFDVKAMVDQLSNEAQYKSIVVNVDDIKYVHGGIAFFGGGKNYNVVKYSENYKNSSNFNLNNYQISLSQTSAAVLAAAAGEEPFYFLLCDANNKNFTPQIQMDLINSGEAYKFLYS